MAKLENLDAIIFDFGGTLDLDGTHWLNAFYLLYEKFSIPVSKSAIKEVFYKADRKLESLQDRKNLTLEPMIRIHIGHQFKMHGIDSATVVEKMTDEFCRIVKANFDKNRQLLESLKSKYRLGLVSNFYGNVAKLCREAGFYPFLDVIIDSDEVGIRKPDPEIFYLAIERLGVTADRAAFVGDSFNQDIKPAKTIGMKTIWLKTQHTAPFPENSQEFVDIEIGTLRKLEEIFL